MGQSWFIDTFSIAQAGGARQAAGLEGRLLGRCRPDAAARQGNRPRPPCAERLCGSASRVRDGDRSGVKHAATRRPENDYNQ